MEALTRVTQQTEKPGRLQLAIIAWQRQLIAKPEALRGEFRPGPRSARDDLIE